MYNEKDKQVNILMQFIRSAWVADGGEGVLNFSHYLCQHWHVTALPDSIPNMEVTEFALWLCDVMKEGCISPPKQKSATHISNPKPRKKEDVWSKARMKAFKLKLICLHIPHTFCQPPYLTQPSCFPTCAHGREKTESQTCLGDCLMSYCDMPRCSLYVEECFYSGTLYILHRHLWWLIHCWW